MENKKPVIVGIGELLWDVLPTGKRAGGAPVNFVYHATQLGAEGYAISAVGNDLAGTEILQELDKTVLATASRRLIIRRAPCLLNSTRASRPTTSWKALPGIIFL